MDAALVKVFSPFHVPPISFKPPRVSRPPAMVVFAAVFVSYILVLSGVIYDMIIEPPSMGQEQDPVTGAIKVVTFVKYRINGQFILEGLSAGMMFGLGGLGFVLVDVSRRASAKTSKTVFLIAGLISIVVAYNALFFFIKQKLPNYLK